MPNLTELHVSNIERGILSLPIQMLGENNLSSKLRVIHLDEPRLSVGSLLALPLERIEKLTLSSHDLTLLIDDDLDHPERDSALPSLVMRAEILAAKLDWNGNGNEMGSILAIEVVPDLQYWRRFMMPTRLISSLAPIWRGIGHIRSFRLLDGFYLDAEFLEEMHSILPSGVNELFFNTAPLVRSVAAEAWRTVGMVMGRLPHFHQSLVICDRQGRLLPEYIGHLISSLTRTLTLTVIPNEPSGKAIEAARTAWRTLQAAGHTGVGLLRLKQIVRPEIRNHLPRVLATERFDDLIDIT